MTDDGLSPLMQELLDTLGALRARLEEALAPLDLTMAKYGTLAELAGADEALPLGVLAERCTCVRSNMTQLVDRLEADGLVVRTADPQDRRSVRAQLTREGRTRHAAAQQALARTERALLAPLDKAHRSALSAALGRLHGARAFRGAD